jgi:Flp pilus assembly protein TadD
VAEARLRKAVELNPFHASAHAMLASVLTTGPAEKRAQAIPAAQTAVKLAPADAFANRVLALALWNVGERDAALARARLSLTLADNDGQRRQSQQLLDFFAKNAAAR